MHDGARTLTECLEAVYRSSYVPFEVIVVDDCSTDDSVAIARRFPCRIISLDRNRGAAVAKNRGAEHAKGDILFFTDSDVLLEEHTLLLLAEDFADPQISGIVGLLSRQLEYHDFCSQYKNLWMHYTYSRLSSHAGVFYTSAAAVKRAAFLQTGGFDENYRGASVTEDTEFGQRLWTAGFTVRVDKRLTVRHMKHYSFGDLMRTDFWRSHGLAKTVLRNRCGRASQKLCCSVPWCCIVGLPFSFLVVLCALLALTGNSSLFLTSAFVSYGVLVALNGHFLGFLRKTNGWTFFGQSCGFLLLDMLAAGLGVVFAVAHFAAGERY